jgi:acetyltransferase-like isoleucine patch superfamily enzyme
MADKKIHGSKMNKNINCKNLILGKNTVIEPTAVIRGINGPAETVVIGDNSYIGHDVQIICDNVSIGDYCKIHHHTNIHGYRPCKIGHNAWIGQYCIIDTIGGTTIGNNCGIGAHSQLWSHIKYGDTLEGCKFLSDAPLNIGNDVWFVGHCIVSPITAADRSMALVGSVITKDMEYNNIYAGSPAKNITDKVGYPFEQVTVENKYKKMCEYLKESNLKNIKIVLNSDSFNYEDNISYFSVSDRTYTKKLTEDEISFMKFLLPDKGKFTPV